MNQIKLSQQLFVGSIKMRDGSKNDRCQQLSEWDVPFGKLSETRMHPGYSRFQHMVESKKLAYLTARRTDKTFIADAIFSAVKSNGGRFLRKENWNDGQKYWVEMDQEKAMTKILQTLRESSRSIQSSESISAQPKAKNIGHGLIHSLADISNSFHCQQNKMLPTQYFVNTQENFSSSQESQEQRGYPSGNEMRSTEKGSSLQQRPSHRATLTETTFSLWEVESTSANTQTSLDMHYFGDTSDLKWDPNVEDLFCEDIECHIPSHQSDPSKSKHSFTSMGSRGAYSKSPGVQSRCVS